MFLSFHFLILFFLKTPSNQVYYVLLIFVFFFFFSLHVSYKVCNQNYPKTIHNHPKPPTTKSNFTQKFNAVKSYYKFSIKC